MKNIKSQDDKNKVIIEYEMGLSNILDNNGFKHASYINKYSHTQNSTILKWDRMIKKYKFPFLKTEIPKHLHLKLLFSLNYQQKHLSKMNQE